MPVYRALTDEVVISVLKKPESSLETACGIKDLVDYLTDHFKHHGNFTALEPWAGEFRQLDLGPLESKEDALIAADMLITR